MLDPESVAEEAQRVVYGPRAATYGHPRGDFEIIGGIWASIIRGRAKFLFPGKTVDEIDWNLVINDEAVAILMSGLKLARLAKTPQHRDSSVDTVGYILCLRRLGEDPSEVQAWNEKVNVHSHSDLSPEACSQSCPGWNGREGQAYGPAEHI